MRLDIKKPIIQYVNDNDSVDYSFIQQWNIQKFCRVNKNDMYAIDFVGYVLSGDKVLLSFPKNYYIYKDDDKNLEAMRNIISLISAGKNMLGSFDGDEEGQFPIKSYLEILNYYKRYGLYHTLTQKEKMGFKGKVNWNKTIQRSNKIVSGNNIVFIPFVLSEKNISPIFLSECMEYVLNDAYNSYSVILDFLIPYRVSSLNEIFNNYDLVIQKLQSFKPILFKDSEKKLLNNLIKYFQWKSNYSRHSNMLTKYFAHYWEVMVNLYLTKKFYYIKNDVMTFNEEKATYKFKKISKVPVEKPNSSYEDSPPPQTRNFTIEYDHFVQEGDTIYLFDSKYSSSELNNLDYKQSFYYYHLRSQYEKASIYNGLVAPTNKAYHSKLHIDRSNIDGLKIVEHYLNLNDVISLSIKHRKEFLSEITKR